MRIKRNIRRTALFLLAAVLILAAGMLFSNQLISDFSQLNETDQAILREYDLFCAQERDAPLWKGYCLSEKTVTLLSKDSLSVYLINPTREIHSIFAKKIKLPDSFSLSSVYRVSLLKPETWRMKASGNFNTLEKTYTLFGNEVYFVHYDQAASLEKPFSSEHFISFLVHESFHYYMQNNWKLESPPYPESLTENDLELLRREYAVLDTVRQHLRNGAADREALLGCAQQYLSVMDARLEANPDYTVSELAKERDEGTATYAGIKAAALVGYDFGVMYFDNVKDVPFSEVFEQMEAGGIERTFLYGRMPYETGAVLCQLMEALEIPGWQETLNSQTLDSPQTLYSVMKEAITVF